MDILGLFEARERLWKDTRTKSSIMADLCYELADTWKFAGKVDNFSEAYERVVAERMKNREFCDALEVIATTCLGLFPVQAEVE